MMDDILKNAQLRGRSLLTLGDLSDKEMIGLLDLADALKRKKREGIRGELLDRKNIGMIFEKPSTRTRCAAAVAAADEGARTEYLSAKDIHLWKKESVTDTARVLGRMFDGIFFRGFGQDRVKQLAEHSGVPVWNGLTDDAHPTQALADLMTVRERFGRLKGLKLVYIGDGRNNVGISLMCGCAKAGVNVVNCTPESLSPPPSMVDAMAAIAAANESTVSVSHDPLDAVKGANVLYTDVWASMGEESKLAERIELLRPFQVNMELVKATGNVDSDNVAFLHCLPAFHDAHTELTREIGAMEVTDEVFESPMSLVFDEAENRMHTIKAAFVAAL